MGNKINTYGSILDQVIGTKLNKFLSPQQNQGGLLNFVKSPYASDIGMGLLAQSGYSTMPTSLGQSLGVAMNQANQLRSQRRANDLSELATLTNLKQLFQDPKKTQRQNKIEALAKRLEGNVNLATDIVDGNITADYDPTTKTTRLFNKVTKKYEDIGGPLSNIVENELSNDKNIFETNNSFIQPKDLTPELVKEHKDNVTSLELQLPKIDKMIDKATSLFGSINRLKDFSAGVAGFTPTQIGDQLLIDEKVVQAKKEYGLLKKELEAELVNNPRFNESEVTRILNLLPDENAFSVSESEGRIALTAVRNELNQKLQFSKSLLSGKNFKVEDLGFGTFDNPLLNVTEEQIPNLPKGTYFYYNGERMIKK